MKIGTNDNRVTKMPGLFRKSALMLVVLFLTGTSNAMASSSDKFQGFWAAEGLTCEKVFKPQPGGATFIDYRGEKAVGLIVKGDRVEGANASCKLVSMKQRANSFAAVLRCREQIIFDTMVVHLRFNGDDELIRFDPEVPELASVFHRCRN